MSEKENKIIIAKNLKKEFKIPEEEKSLFGKIKNILKPKYRTIKALKGISFEIKEGEIVGFLGPNGAGKTTTIKILIGLLYPTKEEVIVLNKEPFKHRKELMKEIGVVFGQKNTLIWELPVIDSLKLLKVAYDINDKEFEKRLGILDKFLGIKEILKKPYRTLSLGQRMKAELLGALIHKPKILFLDEPTIGLDVENKLKMREFLKKINKEWGTTILITTHDMKDVEELCKRIIVIDKGKKIYDGDLETFKRKYTDFKDLKVVFNGVKNKEKLNELAKKGQLTNNILKLKINKEDSIEKIIKEIMEAVEIEDLEIKEPDLEEIILKFYGEKHEKQRNKENVN
ncbi:MAG: ATP-binding cassette domain-containing protein [Nanoarchaeota archaeon]